MDNTYKIMLAIRDENLHDRALGAVMSIKIVDPICTFESGGNVPPDVFRNFNLVVFDDAFAPFSTVDQLESRARRAGSNCHFMYISAAEKPLNANACGIMFLNKNGDFYKNFYGMVWMAYGKHLMSLIKSTPMESFFD